MDSSPFEYYVFIQARMSSGRLPGKVLAPLAGRPVIAHVIERISRAVPRDRIVVATSTEASDDPLARFVQGLGTGLFRGPLENVFLRFQLCLKAHPCAWFCRISADSPLFDPEVLRIVRSRAGGDIVDLVTNVFPRSFPKGHSVEFLRAAPFARIDPHSLTQDQKEHVTRAYYDDPSRFRIVNVESGDPARASINLCVDTSEDLARAEKLIAEEASAPASEGGAS